MPPIGTDRPSTAFLFNRPRPDHGVTEKAASVDHVNLSDASMAWLAGDTPQVALPTLPSMATSDMTASQVGVLADRREGQLRNSLRGISAISDPSLRHQAMSGLAAQFHDPVDIYLMQEMKSTGRLDSNPHVFADTENMMVQNRTRDVRNGKQIDASLLPRLMVQRQDEQAFGELGKEVRQNLGPLASAHDVVSNIAQLVPDLGLRTSVSEADRLSVGKVRQDYPQASPQKHLVQAGIGNCGEWAYSMHSALRGAGVPANVMTASWTANSTFMGLHDHAAAAYQDEGGHWSMLEPFQYGHEHRGRLDGFGTSNYAGDWSSQSWRDHQEAEGNLYHTVEDPSH